MRTYGVGMRGGFLVIEGWVSLIDNFRRLGSEE